MRGNYASKSAECKRYYRFESSDKLRTERTVYVACIGTSSEYLALTRKHSQPKLVNSDET